MMNSEFTISSSLPEYKSQGKFGGNTIIYFTKSFNWFQRFMWKVCFGLEIKNLKEDIENENND